MVATRLMTIEDLAALPDDDRFYELIEGELIEMSPASTPHSIIASRLNRALVLYSSVRDDLHVWVSDAGFLLGRNPDTVLAPDISILTKDQLTSLGLDSKGFTELAPILAIEVKSPSNTKAEIAKIYLAAGVKEVWWVRPEVQQVTVHRPDRAPQVVAFDGVLSSGDLLPGFELPLSELFSA